MLLGLLKRQIIKNYLPNPSITGQKLSPRRLESAETYGPGGEGRGTDPQAASARKTSPKPYIYVLRIQENTGKPLTPLTLNLRHTSSIELIKKLQSDPTGGVPGGRRV